MPNSSYIFFCVTVAVTSYGETQSSLALIISILEAEPPSEKFGHVLRLVWHVQVVRTTRSRCGFTGLTKYRVHPMSVRKCQLSSVRW